MGAVFVKILNMSLTAGWIVLAVLLVRLLFKKKAPKALFPILWAMVAVRLVCPVTFESSFSLIRNAEPVEQEMITRNFLSKEDNHGEKNSQAEKNPEDTEPVLLENTGEKIPVDDKGFLSGNGSEDALGMSEGVALPAEPIPGTDVKENNTENAGTATENISFSGTDNESRNRVSEKKTDLSVVATIIWLSGIGIMLFYSAFSYIRIYRRVAESAPLADKVRVCDGIESPFILGMFRPCIYLPSDIREEDRIYVLAHERAHLKRFDHFWKPLGFLLLSVYWFHPLLWVGYILLCKDIEYACDEKVIKELGKEQKKTYSTALINCSVPKKMISACPLAFGENGVKGRVKSVLHYKKPAFWIMIASVLICGVLAVCFLTNPLRKEKLPKPGDIITFGTYEQDNVTENGAEPIEWMVLDVFDGKASLISVYGLDAKPFHDDGKYGATWAECSLRGWLNNEFYEKAFDEKSRKQILTTRLENYCSEEYDVFIGQTYTEDKVYLLSIDELLQSFGTDSRIPSDSRTSRITATDYAKAQGVWEGVTDNGIFSPWLLRTPGVSSNHTTRVSSQGTLSYVSNNTYSGNAIRPAIRISLADGNYEIVKSTESEEETTQGEATPHTRVGRFVDVVPLEEAKPGYVVKFGQYETRDSDCVEVYDIEWYVLDVRDGKALLLSKYIMEYMPYHEREEEVGWADCTLREWLNETFYNEAFNEEEQARIATTLLENVWNPWNTSAEYEYTEDKVFLPAIEDMLSGDYDYMVAFPESTTYRFDGYFQTDRERVARPTKALKWNTEYELRHSTRWYWLRASSQLVKLPASAAYDYYHDVATIYHDGSFGVGDTPVRNTGGVRPAIWVEIGDLDGKDIKDTNRHTESKKKGSAFKATDLPERYDYKELKEAFLEYLNHQAYFYPEKYPQEKYTCNFEVYCTADSKMKRVYLKTVNDGTDAWYLCTPSVYLDESAPFIVSSMNTDSVSALLKKDAIAYLGTDSIKVPAVTKPEYHKATEDERNEYKESLVYISELLHKNGYTKKNGIIDTIKLELWISEFDMEKKLLPYAYVVINDTLVYETSFSKYEGLYGSFYKNNQTKDISLKELFGENASMPDEFDGRSIKPLSAADTKRMERVKECASLHYVYEKEFSETIVIDGKEVTIPKQNVDADEYRGIAFVPTKTVGNITHYDIYRRSKAEEPWYLISKDYRTAAGDIAAIVTPMKDHIVCYFERNSETESRCILSEDGGVTWSQPVQTARPNAELKDAAIGTSVVFGSYRQDNDWDNGDEELEWIVLDRVGDKVLLLSKYGIYTNVYHNVYYNESYEGTTWENCFMREWLQERFYVDAFTARERDMIAKTVNKTPKSGGGYISTEDYVFLLSASEVLYGKAQNGTPYFKDDVARMLIPTARETWACCIDGNNEFNWWTGLNAEWWLRDPGEKKEYAAVVKNDGSISRVGNYYHSYDTAIRPAIWVDISSLSEGGKNTAEKENVVISPIVGILTERIEQSGISIAIGDEYAAYLDETGNLHVLYDTSKVDEHDKVGATGGIDLTRTYKSLGTDPYRLVAINEFGGVSVSYHMTASELEEYTRKAGKDAIDAGGTYGLGGPKAWMAREFERMSDAKQIFSTYPYGDYTALFEEGRVYNRGKYLYLEGVVEIADAADGVIAGIKEDGTLVMTEVTDVFRKEKLDAWPEKLKQICTGSGLNGEFFVGLREDGTVISEGVEQEYMINTVEKWSDIVKIAVGKETVVGLRGDGTVVAICPARSDKGQCEVDDWTDVIAINTNGKVTIGITKDGAVLMAGEVPEIIQ